MKNKAFTLLELVVVIIILGVLATLGFTQYGRMVERGREAEVRMIFGDMRKLAYAYYLANGSITGIGSSDVNIGTNPDQIPQTCTGTHYFRYVKSTTSDPNRFWMEACRCTSGGKSPQGASQYEIELISNFVTGEDIWNRREPCAY